MFRSTDARVRRSLRIGLLAWGLFGAGCRNVNVIGEWVTTSDGGSGEAAYAYDCGWSSAGHDCTYYEWIPFRIAAPSLRSAIAACSTMRFTSFSDLCFVVAADEPGPNDAAECLAPARWQPLCDRCDLIVPLACP
jgi:hypothetical protein